MHEPSCARLRFLTLGRFECFPQVAFVLNLSSYVKRQSTTKLIRRLHLDVNGVARQIMATNSKVSGENDV